MSSATANVTCNWLCTGDEIFPAMLAAIEGAKTEVCLETYTFSAGSPGERFRDVLVRAQQRGLRVRVLIDALGSYTLPGNFFEPLRSAGAEVRVFNPLALNRLSIRNHRKLLVCDDNVAFVGGFNIAPEYEGDGVKCGWCDVGLGITGPLAAQLASSFDEMFARADFRHKRFMRFRRFDAKKSVTWPAEQILFGGPGRGKSPIKHALRRDLENARDVKIIVAYFLPTWSLRRGLTEVVRRGGSVQLILAGKSDVLLSQLAGRSLYRRFLKAGVEIYEYEPQVLHAKLIIVDDVVYIGSSNLDQRSLQINYELMIRFESREMANQAREVFAGTLKHSRPIELEQWRKSRTLWQKIKQRFAYWILVRIDPYFARRQWRSLPD
ncbi:MAG TPA: phospholipase D-like domain-containing protein [Verrucomicrobiae bacterium]|jgi:cardiolipin synthase|nr:phospholipase D-like domain-containing protein [Verrucomicrobiae bacterium]